MIGLDRIYLGDCLDLMKGIDKGSIDAIYTDIPYESSFNKHTIPNIGQGHGFSKSASERLAPIMNGIDYDAFARESLRVMKRPNLYVWCSFNQTFKIRDALERATRKKLVYSLLVWHKLGTCLMNYGQWLPDLEYCLVATDGMGIANEERLRPTRIYESTLNSRENTEWGHPTVKPLAMVRQHIRLITPPIPRCLTHSAEAGRPALPARNSGGTSLGWNLTGLITKGASQGSKGYRSRPKGTEWYKAHYFKGKKGSIHEEHD